MMIFRVYWSKLPDQIKAKYLCRTHNAYRTQRGSY